MKRSLKMLLTMLFATVFLVSFALGTNAAWSYRWLIEPNPLYRSFDSVTEDFAVFFGGESYFYKRGVVRLSDKKEIVPAEYNDIRLLANGHFALGKNITPGRAPGPGEWGVCTADGTVVVPFDYIYGFTALGDKYLVAQNADRKYGVIDYAGNVVLPFEYDYLMPKHYPCADSALYETHDDSPLFARKSEKYGLIDLSGKILIPFEYASLSQNYGNPQIGLISAAVPRENGYFEGLIDYAGNVVFSFDYAHNYFISDNVLIVYQSDSSGQRYGMVDTSGNILLPLEYDNLSLFYGMYPSDKLKRSELVQAVSHGKTGVFDLAGKPVVPIAYGAVNLFDNDRILVEKDGKWGMIDRAGNVLLPFDYDYLERLSDTLLQAKKGDLFAAIRPDGTEVTPYEFTNFRYSYQDGFIVGCKGISMYGVLDADGNTCIPYVYDDIYAADSVNLSEKPLWKVQQGENWLLLDADGKEIFRRPCSDLQYNAKLGLCSVITENGAGILKISYSKPVSYRRIVTVSTDTSNVRLTLGDTSAFVNAEAKTLDTPPFLRGDRTFVPVRFLAESLGAEVFWDDSTKTASFVKNGTTVRLIIGQNTAYVNSEPRTLDATIFLENDRTYAPLRFVAETLGAAVEYKEEALTE